MTESGQRFRAHAQSAQRAQRARSAKSVYRAPSRRSCTGAGPGRPGLLHDYLRRIVASACGIEAREVAADTPLLALGIDWLAVNSIRHSIEADLGAHVTVSDLVHSTSLADLAILVDEQVRADVAPWQIEVPLSRGQRSPWLPHEIEPGSAGHSIAVALRLRGEVDIPALECALDALVARHASLRKAFPSVGDEPARPVAAWARTWLRENDASDLDDSQLTKWLECAAHEPFDGARGPLLRVHLYRRAADETVVLVVAHHIVTDFWSMTTLVHELEMLYAGQTGGTSAPPPELAVTQGSFVRLYRWVSGSRMSVHAALSPDPLVCLPEPLLRASAMPTTAALSPAGC